MVQGAAVMESFQFCHVQEHLMVDRNTAIGNLLRESATPASEHSTHIEECLQPIKLHTSSMELVFGLIATAAAS